MKIVTLLCCLFVLSADYCLAQEQDVGRAEQSRRLPDEGLDSVNVGDSALQDASTSAEKRKPRRPEFVPTGWKNDFDYKSSLDEYLNDKFLAAKSVNKNTYIYLYADWLEKCREFRRSADRGDIGKLFAKNEIIMIEYNYFKRKFDMKSRQLPMIIKINENSRIGPETNYPAAKVNQHPRKVFHKLRKFFAE